MSLQLSGKTEKMVDPYKEFYGPVNKQMPLLVSGKDEKGNVVDVPRIPASFAYVIERRMTAPEDVRDEWQLNYFFTGDGSTAGKKGDHLVVLDAKPLRELNEQSELYNRALVLSDKTWNELKKQKDTALYLTAKEVKNADGKGYVRKEGIWVPANKTVGKAWEHLGRGKVSKEYLELASKNSPDSDSLLNLYFNQTLNGNKPTMRAWVAGGVDGDSLALGINLIDYDVGRLAGVAPEAHVAREKALEARVKSALKTGQAFEFNGKLYAPVSGVSLK